MNAARGTGHPDDVLFHDRVLVDRARHGDESAFDELYRRLAPPAWRLALAVTRDPAVAGGAVADAFATTLAGSGHPIAVPVRAQLLLAVRQAAADPSLRPVAVPAMAARGGAGLAEAFAGLPERWRSALWVLDEEDVPLTDAAVILALPEDGVVPLLERARSGLGEQVVAVEARGLTGKCRQTVDRLVDYAADRLAARDRDRVRGHLDACAWCRGFLADVDDLAPALRRLSPPLPLVLAGPVADRWQAALVREVGPLHLTLPTGRPMPAWVERTVAGAAAAVIALGIASAVLHAGRGGRVRDDRLARPVPAVAPFGSADGESALGGTADLSGLDEFLAGGTGGSADPSGSTDASRVLTGDAARGLAGPPTNGAAPAVTTPPATPTDPDDPAPAAPPAPPVAPEVTEPAAEVTIDLGGVVGVTIGDQCTGVTVADTTLGCAPAPTDDPAPVTTGGSLLAPLGL